MSTPFLRRVVLVACAALVACASPSQPPSSTVVRVACVGDSITYGHGIADRANDTYPAVLGKLLGPSYDVRNFGVPGATLLRKGNKPYWTLDAFHAATGFNPQIVVLKLGTNDSKPKNWTFQDGFEKDCGDLIDHFASLPAKPKIWVCLPAPAAPNRFGIDGAIIKDQVIPRIRKAAAAKKVPIIDLDVAFKGRMDLLPDNVHPNEAGAALIARSVHAALTIKTD